MTTVKLLTSEMEICDLHAARMKMAINHLRNLLPFKPEIFEKLSDEQLGFLELLTSRFAKLQDTIGQKVFPLLLSLLQEEIRNTSFIDRLNRLAKIGALENAEYWNKFRETRNSIAHDYPDDADFMCNSLNLCVSQSHELLEYWQFLKSFALEKMANLQNS